MNKNERVLKSYNNYRRWFDPVLLEQNNEEVRPFVNSNHPINESIVKTKRCDLWGGFLEPYFKGSIVQQQRHLSSYENSLKKA